jgi:hypothetical protein
VRPRHACSLHQADQGLHDLRHRRPELRLGLLTTLQRQWQNERQKLLQAGKECCSPRQREDGWCLPGHTARSRRRSGRGISKGTDPSAPGRPSGPARRCRAAAAWPIGPETAPAAAMICTSSDSKVQVQRADASMLLLVLHQKKSEAPFGFR